MQNTVKANSQDTKLPVLQDAVDSDMPKLDYIFVQFNHLRIKEKTQF